MKKLKIENAAVMLLKELLADRNLSQRYVAKKIYASQFIIWKIVNGKRIFTPDMDLRLCKFFGFSEGYFLRLQMRYDIEEAKRKLGKTLNKIKKININS